MTTNPPLIYTPLSLNLPIVPLRLRPSSRGARRPEVFCPLRRRWTPLTPEEEVRQRFVGWLAGALGYPLSLMAIELAITLPSGASRRCDTVVFDHTGRHPLAIVEYKAPSVRLTPAVFAQAAVYNTLLSAPVIIISNGLTHYCAAITAPGQPPRFLNAIPRYSDLTSLNNPPSDENRPSSSNSL